jgi:hypothetical protein
MATPLIPQEVFVLERFCSLERFELLRDAWAEMLRYAEIKLDEFMQQLPPDYRSRPLNAQPDVVWGTRILPNFRDTMAGLNTGFIEMTKNDWWGLRDAGGVSNAFIGFQRDYSADWMNEVTLGAEDVFWSLLSKAMSIADPIVTTVRRGWLAGELVGEYKDYLPKEPLNPPSSWPLYQLNPNVRIKTGDRIERSGIYLPDIDHGVATVLIQTHSDWDMAPEASVPDEVDPSGYLATGWTLVERVADEGGGIPGDPDPVRAGVRLRAVAGEHCPRSGYWMTPARVGGRQRFEIGQTMPDVGSDWGSTIWQWDLKQD